MLNRNTESDLHNSDVSEKCLQNYGEKGEQDESRQKEDRTAGGECGFFVGKDGFPLYV